jgi:DNA-binding transcriptional ArsR family regulator
MLKLSFTARDVAHVRFAFSPLWEIVASVRVLKTAAEHPLHHPWVSRVRVDPGPLLAALVPVPTVPLPDLDLELAALRATPPDQVRENLDGLPGARPPALDPLYTDPVAGLDRLVEEIRAYWDSALAPYWPRILTLLQGDILHRARRLTEGGTDRLFADLDPRIRWDSDTLYVANDNVDRSVRLGGRGLLLVPSVFVWPRVFAKLDPPWQPVLRYAPRGVGVLWESATTAPSAALAGVLGRSRAELLTALDAPASTLDLARRTGLTPGGVSQHLTALKAAGLVSAHRAGRFVLYARTSVAEELITDSC